MSPSTLEKKPCEADAKMIEIHLRSFRRSCVMVPQRSPMQMQLLSKGALAIWVYDAGEKYYQDENIRR